MAGWVELGFAQGIARPSDSSYEARGYLAVSHGEDGEDGEDG